MHKMNHGFFKFNNMETYSNIMFDCFICAMIEKLRSIKNLNLEEHRNILYYHQVFKIHIYFKFFFLNTIIGNKLDINITLRKSVIQTVKFNNKTAVL